MRLRISARSSDLARIQAFQVGEALKKKVSQLEVVYQFRESLGDKNLSDPLWKMPEKGVFTEDFLKDLLEDQTDLVVHSWKDLPTEEKAETFIAATLARADQRDLLLYKKNSHGNANPKLFSSSPRRAYNLKSFFKKTLPWSVEEVHFHDVRGNVPTRLRKLLENPEADGLILAKAALDRLMSAPQAEFKKVQELILEQMKLLSWQVLPLSVNPAAAAQGALAIECKKNRQDLIDLLQEINSESDQLCVHEERKTLKSYGGGCHQKIGISILNKNRLGRDFKIHFLRGLTDQGEVLLSSESRWLGKDLRPTGLNEGQIMDSRDLWKSVRRQNLEPALLNKNLHLALKTKAILVTKPEALPDLQNQAELSPEVLWCSGLKTWEELSSRGIWVNGTLDSLGEEDLPALQSWMGQARSWCKVSHQDVPAVGAESFLKSFETYQVHREIKSLDLSKVKIIFWRSGAEFLQAVKQFPEIRSKEFACGLGSTAQTLCLSGVPSEKIHLYLSVEEWRKKCLS